MVSRFLVFHGYDDLDDIRIYLLILTLLLLSSRLALNMCMYAFLRQMVSWLYNYLRICSVVLFLEEFGLLTFCLNHSLFMHPTHNTYIMIMFRSILMIFITHFVKWLLLCYLSHLFILLRAFVILNVLLDSKHFILSMQSLSYDEW